jgi:hypothetical protein
LKETESYAPDSLLPWIAVNADALNAKTEGSPKHFIAHACDVGRFVDRLKYHCEKDPVTLRPNPETFTTKVASIEKTTAVL